MVTLLHILSIFPVHAPVYIIQVSTVIQSKYHAGIYHDYI